MTTRGNLEMKKVIVRVLGAIVVLFGLGDAIMAGTVFRQMLGGVTIILGILLFILGEVCEISETLKLKEVGETK